MASSTAKNGHLCMFNKNNSQHHYGIGNQYQTIDQSVANNVFVTYGEPSPSSSSDDGLWVFILPILGITSLASFFIQWIQAHFLFIFIGQLLFLLPTNIYVYIRSRNYKTLLTELIPSVLTILSSYFAIHIELPKAIHQLFEKAAVTPNFKSFQEFINQTVPQIIEKFGSISQEDSSTVLICSIIYLLLLAGLLASPAFISYNAYIKKSIKNEFSIILVILFWSFYAGLTFFL